jgi:hypothetical protein
VTDQSGSLTTQPILGELDERSSRSVPEQLRRDTLAGRRHRGGASCIGTLIPAVTVNTTRASRDGHAVPRSFGGDRTGSAETLALDRA